MTNSRLSTPGNHLTDGMTSVSTATRFVSFAGKAALLGLGFSLLLSCAVPAPTPRPDLTEVTPEQAFAQGNYEQAARLWQQKAMTASDPEAASLRISAADSWLMADRADLARDNLRWVEKTILSPSDLARMNLVQADFSLRANRPDEAELLLQQAASDLPDSSRQRFEQLQQNTAQMLARPGSADLSKFMALSSAMTYYQAQQALTVLQSLENIPSGELALHAGNPRGDQTIRGWLDLALVIRQNLVNPEHLPQVMSDWKGRYPYHFMTENEALDLWLRYRQQFTHPGKVAVLLPDSGRLQAASEAIRDGMMSAYLEQPGGAELIFLPVGEEVESATAAYFQARDLGADWIIGPLQKQSIESLLGLAGLATPMLALNELPTDYMAPPGLSGQLYGLSLSQDEEARALAREMAHAGYSKAIVLAPETGWGERIVQNFSEEFLHENRQIVVSSRYVESENDHSPVLQRVLKIDESKARKQQLENTLQVSLEFEPIRRDDVDVIFLAANSTQGRLLRPQLRFHDAGDIPVYATGRIFTGRSDSARDQDLNGVRFPLTPLQLDMIATDSLPELASLRGGSFASLYALGRDAWNILPWLGLMKLDRDFRFGGASGKYQAGISGKLIRDPGFAMFSKGIPVPLEPAQEATITH